MTAGIGNGFRLLVERVLRLVEDAGDRFWAGAVAQVHQEIRRDDRRMQQVELRGALLAELDRVVDGMLRVFGEIRGYEDLVDLHLRSFVVSQKGGFR